MSILSILFNLNVDMLHLVSNLKNFLLSTMAKVNAITIFVTVSLLCVHRMYYSSAEFYVIHRKRRTPQKTNTPTAALVISSDEVSVGNIFCG